MKAVVMAGGEGSRLRPLTIRRPKPMVPIAGKPVMEHILNLLKRHGITEVVVTVQYLASSIEDYFGNGSQFGMHITYSREDVPLGTAGSVKNAEEHLTEPFLVISGDALTDYDLTDLIKYHNEKKSLATLLLAHVHNPLEYGVIITNEDGHITQFLEKPSWGEVFSDTINTGIYVLDPKIFTYFEKDKPFDFSQELFPMMLKQGDPIYGYIAPKGYWCDVGNLSEYMRANADALQGRVDIEIPAKNIGNNIWCEEGVEIDGSAQLYGPVYLAHDCKVRQGAIIHGPSIIGGYAIIDERAQIDRSIVWNNSYIGERAELRGAIVGTSTSVKGKAVMFEGSVIGDNSTIQDGAIIQPNVKIWPDKEIEAGAVVNTSIIWGSQGRRSLFSRHGVTGLVNVDITPEFATKIGAAYGAILARGATVCLNRDEHRTSRMIKRGINAGLPSAGVNVWDINQVPIPVARYFIRNTDAVGGVHVRVSPYDPRVVDIKIFDHNGLDINKTTERKIENLFFREDYRRVYMDEIGAINVLSDSDVCGRYMQGFNRTIKHEVIRERKYQLVVDYAHSSTILMLPQIFDDLGCEVIVLNTSRDEGAPSSPDDEGRAMQRLAAVTSALNMDMGIRIDPGGERIWIVDDRGRILDGMKLLAVMTSLFLRENRGGTVAAPVTAPSVLQHIAKRYDGYIQHTKVLPHALMTAAMREGVVLVGDGRGGFVFPSLQPAFDSMLAIAKLLELLATFEMRLSEVVDDLPAYYMSMTRVTCPWEHKGKVMRILSEQYRERRAKPIDGIKIDLGSEWVLVLPDADNPLFHVVAESTSNEQAQALAEKYARVVSGLQQ
ncbi:mannose-1-phosphate guanylyltransferase/phosphomannomutase [Thermosporothrix hazakensis]|uniref:Mannose-1-phosphate guanylyltransferase/phosphomannomutase n=1 Tax=Thermosporothrix hazakensis TaxID=644383 RepID=A0A326UDX1_THEHA|nr:mannose-1-phosphate guanyltransferase [Thermosporothrix hazakensis]PZW36254.1 mannose-1-phosphate guanylyltransferase/phosphomannomutase [Thermosporothrix hazakensis]GCE46903.1 nucleotidyltransferase [Thermosporothrix hazakensis]